MKILPLFGNETSITPLPTPLIYQGGRVESCLPSWDFSRAKDSPKLVESILEPEKHIQEINAYNQDMRRGSEFLFNTPEQVIIAINASRDLLSDGLNCESNEMIKTGESEHISKLSIQRRPTPYHHADRSIPVDKPLPPEFVKLAKGFISKVIERGLATLEKHDPISIMLEDSDPMKTSSGYPLFSSQPEHRLLVAAALGMNGFPSSLADFKKALYNIRLSLDLPDMGFLPAAIGKRLGVAKGEVNEWVLSNRKLIARYTTKALRCRTRRIYMESFLFNMMVSPVTYVLKKGLATYPHFKHDTENEKITSKWFDHATESDLSSYDESITKTMKMLIWDICKENDLNPVSCDILMEAENSGTVITSSSHGSNLVEVLEGSTGLRSGQKGTSIIGTLLDFLTILYAYIKMGIWTELNGFDPEALPNVVVQSDDVLNPYSFTPAQIEIYEQTYVELGFKVKIVQARRFLMKHRINGKAYPVLARLVQQTLSNEHPILHPGQLLIGLAARIADGPYPSLIPLFMKWVKDVLYKLTRFSELGIPYNDNIFKWKATIISSPHIPQFLNSRIGLQWMEEAIQEASYRPAAMDVLNLLKDLNISIPLTDSIAFREALVTSMFNTDIKIVNSSRRKLSTLSNR